MGVYLVSDGGSRPWRCSIRAPGGYFAAPGDYSGSVLTISMPDRFRSLGWIRLHDARRVPAGRGRHHRHDGPGVWRGRPIGLVRNHWPVSASLFQYVQCKMALGSATVSEGCSDVALLWPVLCTGWRSMSCVLRLANWPCTDSLVEE